MTNEELQAELDRLKRQNAAMREALTELTKLNGTISFEMTDEGQAAFDYIMKQVKSSLSGSAGTAPGRVVRSF